MTITNLQIGSLGEKIALTYLKKLKYSILETNFRSHWGEIDIICQKDNKISFIEVKTRVGTTHGQPYEAVNYYKVKDLKRTINYYLLKKNLKNYKLSLDVISIILNNDHKVQSLKYLENIDWG